MLKNGLRLANPFSRSTEKSPLGKPDKDVNRQMDDYFVVCYIKNSTRPEMVLLPETEKYASLSSLYLDGASLYRINRNIVMPGDTRA